VHTFFLVTLISGKQENLLNIWQHAASNWGIKTTLKRNCQTVTFSEKYKICYQHFQLTFGHHGRGYSRVPEGRLASSGRL
jgi:hypothetical protein